MSVAEVDGEINEVVGPSDGECAEGDIKGETTSCTEAVVLSKCCNASNLTRSSFFLALSRRFINRASRGVIVSRPLLEGESNISLPSFRFLMEFCLLIESCCGVGAGGAGFKSTLKSCFLKVSCLF